MVTRLVTLGLAAAAAVSFAAPASACRSSCTGSTGSTGGESVPAPAGFALFALGATLLATRRWKG